MGIGPKSASVPGSVARGGLGRGEGSGPIADAESAATIKTFSQEFARTRRALVGW